ncbi:tyrosine-type recombinase/integrase [Clostridium sp. MT-14]|uniref:tyrosine-type recombinase/integrase n=1 Tax=Clostridium sp. MT-14 TaxID=3348360 RepID=UPI0035F2C1C9
MKGGVRKRGKTWSYYFYIGEINGKKKMKEKSGFKSKPIAEKAMRDALYEYEHGNYIEPKKIILTQFALEWLENYIKPLRKITTYNRYKELINKYLSPAIGHINIVEIQPIHIEKMLLDIKKENTIGSSTLQAIYTITNTIMNRALKLKLIRDNPCKYIERPKRSNYKAEILDADEIPELYNVLNLSNIYDYMFHIALRMTLELGLRRGELGGLEWKDINFKDNTISIRNNLIYTEGHVYLVDPKTDKSIRVVYISDQNLDLLKQLQEKQSENKKKYGKFYTEKNTFRDNSNEYDLVMVWQDGKYIHPMYYLNKLKKVLKKAKITKNVTFHNLRHTNATLLLQEGNDLKVIQERLGHKDISTTANIYSHVNKKMQKRATDSISKLIDG